MKKIRVIEKMTTFLIIMLLLTNNLKKKDELYTYKNLVKSVEDDINYLKEEGDCYRSTISVLEATKEKDFLELSTNKKDIIKLQNLVRTYKKKRVSTALVYRDIFTHDTTIKTVVLIDTLFTQKVLEEAYNGFVNTPWYSIKSVATKDSTKYQLNVKNDISLVIKRDKGSFLKQGRLYGVIQDKNPYSTIKDLRIYQKSTERVKRFGIGPYIGAGINFDKNRSSIGFQFGVGIQYGIIKF